MGSYVTQTRNRPNIDARWEYRLNDRNPEVGDYSLYGNYGTQQTTTSFRSGRAEYDEDAHQLLASTSKDGRRPKADNGHVFDTVSTRLVASHPQVSFYTDDWNTYKGPLIPFNPTDGWQSLDRFQELKPEYSDSNLNALGAKAIANSLPTKSVANLSQFIGELREGLPTLVSSTVTSIGKKKSISKGAGSDYLNYQFGLKPLVGDIMKFAKAVTRSTEFIQWMIDHSDRPVSGSFVFPQERVVEVDERRMELQYLLDTPTVLRSAYYTNIYNPGYGDRKPATIFSSRSVTRKVHFKGSFIYHLEDGSGLLAKAKAYEQLANKLLGTRFNLSTLYELTPWSWLLDWYADIGDVLTNYEAFSSDGLVLRYGYLMSETRWDIHHTLPSGIFQGVNGTLDAHMWRTRKQRVRSTPYGFGLQPSGFTDGQWSILAALGMTKAPRVLR